ncbi:hypothetical protein N0V95_006031 [Ascochyta clinopodiicola]|nr:hypothetical protein N0V95_006031 [Ascochyta clinopodiicola]
MTDTASNKRKANSDARGDGDSKRSKGKKRWDMPRRGNAEARQINPGDVGIWATCAMKKEAPTVADLRDLFQVYATKLYGEEAVDGATEDNDSDAGGDIEAEINKELADIRKPVVKPLFTSVKLDTQCCIEKANQKGLESVAEQVLAPLFHGEGNEGKKNIIGMSVVGPDFDKLKRYNIEELRQTPSASATEVPAPAAPTEDA